MAPRAFRIFSVLATWSDALDYLYGLANWETRPPGTLPTFELDRIRHLLASLGQPQLRWPAVHVAGTNGKGSTAAMIAAGLSAAGYRTGLYTSPHLHTIRERIQIDGQPVSEQDVLDWLNQHRVALDAERGLTTFEALTAMACHVFALARVDVAVIEVGLGGRLDSTQVVQPVVSVLSPIDLDHTAVLGNTIGLIAADKCGILRAGVPVVSAPQTSEAEAVIEARCREIGAPRIRVGREVRWRASSVARDGQELQISTRSLAGPLHHYSVKTPLLGSHQQVNAATAVATLDALRRLGWRIGPRQVRVGLAGTRWPARFEILGDRPPLVVDGAHNPHGARHLSQALAEIFHGAGRHLIFGCSRDKDIAGILAALLPEAVSITVAAAHHPRAMPVGELAAQVAACGRSAMVADSPVVALAEAHRVAQATDVIVATGSLFLAAEVRLAWLERAGEPLPPSDPWR